MLVKVLKADGMPFHRITGWIKDQKKARYSWGGREGVNVDIDVVFKKDQMIYHGDKLIIELELDVGYAKPAEQKQLL